MTRCEKCGATVPDDRDLTCVPAVVQDSGVAAAGGTFERKPYTKRYVDVKIVG